MSCYLSTTINVRKIYIIQLFLLPTLMHSFLFINKCMLHRLRADCRAVCPQPVYCAAVYRERRYQMLCEYNLPPEDGHVNARNVSRIVV